MYRSFLFAKGKEEKKSYYKAGRKCFEKANEKRKIGLRIGDIFGSSLFSVGSQLQRWQAEIQLAGDQV